MNIFVFDIETIPDTDGGRRLYSLDGLNDKEVANVMFQKRRQETGGSEFLRLHLHKIVSISVILRTTDKLNVWSLGDAKSSEQELLQRFFDGLDRFLPVLVSWNGTNFDLPVIHYRSLINSISAPRYWEMGEEDSSFRWNNYINRFHWRHTDLMDVLAGFSPRANAPLDDIATMLGFPGKMGMSGDKVWDAYQQGNVEDIRNYCETDVLNTYLVYLRFQLFRGQLTQEEYAQECSMLRDVVKNQGKSHMDSFLTHWNNSDRV